MGDHRRDLDELPYLDGRAWKIGDRVSCESILPERHRDGALGAGALGDVDPTLAEGVSAGDFLVAGLEFGLGRATPAVARALKRIGFAAVIARSFGAELFRAAIHVGLPALRVEETEAVKTGDRLRVDIEGRKVVNLSSGDRYVIRNLRDETLDILRAGGMVEYAASKK
jgi:3-isopropylmalate/(R)-2-methylmalate dehydratase small subunit